MPVLPLLHTPPVRALFNELVRPIHIYGNPVIGSCGFTVTTLVAIQPVGSI
jgi:hypothetical protein